MLLGESDGWNDREVFIYELHLRLIKRAILPQKVALTAGITRVRVEARADNVGTLAFYRKHGYLQVTEVLGMYHGAEDSVRLAKSLCALKHPWRRRARADEHGQALAKTRAYMKELLTIQLSLQTWFLIAAVQTIVGATIIAVANGIWFAAQGEWLVLAGAPVAVLFALLGAFLMALLSFPA
jgi:hypothetical protein